MPLPGLADDVVYSIASSGDDIWVGRQRGGLTRFHFDGVRFTSHTFTRRDGLPQDSVYAVHAARDGAIWAGTLSGGISRYSGGGLHDVHDRQRSRGQYHHGDRRRSGRQSVAGNAERRQPLAAE